ncbi:MAG: oligoendopeptidase F [Bacillota bacterium]|nr:oligoendopeptidase F [Bacillota bacterium]
MQKRLTRAEVPVEMTWDLTHIFPTPEAWEAAFAAVEGGIASVTRYRGTLGQGATTFLACLEAEEELRKRFIPVMSYASLGLATDGTSAANQVAAGRVGALMARLQAETSFIRTEPLALPEGTLERYMAAEPGLEPFRRTIERMLEEKPHILGAETEVALAALGEVLDAPGMIYNRSKASDLAFDPVTDKNGTVLPMSFPGYEGRYERSADAILRRHAYASFTKGLKAYKNTYAAGWATEVKKNVVLARLRGYRSATHMILSRQEVTEDVYHRLHDIILTELAPHMRRYTELRKRVLGLDKLLYCDIEAPLDPEYSPETTYETASEVIIQGLSVLGPEYTAIIEEGLRSRWIDRADNVGKRSGAFCNTVYGVHPYICMTWTGNMRNALTLSHELGHGGHGVLSQRYQRLSNTRASMFFVEAPSTINEILVGQSILERSTDARMRRWVMMQLLATYHHNFVRHLIEGELQRRTYVLAEKGRPLTEATLSKIQGEILAEFWGDTVEIDDGARLTWMRQGHYYSGLYPYSYSAGLTVGTSVAQAIQQDGQPAVDRWLGVLKAGGTKKPLELAKMAGVDMTKPDPIRKAVSFVGWLVDEVVKSF